MNIWVVFHHCNARRQQLHVPKDSMCQEATYAVQSILYFLSPQYYHSSRQLQHTWGVFVMLMENEDLYAYGNSVAMNESSMKL